MSITIVKGIEIKGVRRPEVRRETEMVDDTGTDASARSPAQQLEAIKKQLKEKYHYKVGNTSLRKDSKPIHDMIKNLEIPDLKPAEKEDRARNEAELHKMLRTSSGTSGIRNSIAYTEQSSSIKEPEPRKISSGGVRRHTEEFNTALQASDCVTEKKYRASCQYQPHTSRSPSRNSFKSSSSSNNSPHHSKRYNFRTEYLLLHNPQWK